MAISFIVFVLWEYHDGSNLGLQLPETFVWLKR